MTVYLTCILVALAIGALAAWSDWRGMTIPNVYSVIIAGTFVVCLGALWLFGRQDVFGAPWAHLLSALAVFLVTAGMFALRSIGAGDSKLATAFALWIGLKGIAAFLFYTTLIGGLLGVCALILQRLKPFKNAPEGSWIRQVQDGANKVPYGIAIAGGALAAFGYLGYFDMALLRSFLSP